VSSRKLRLGPVCRFAVLIFIAVVFYSLPLYAIGPCDNEASLLLVSGVWEGRLSVGSASLRLAFAINLTEDGKAVATMDSLDQGVKGIPIASVAFDGQTLTLNVTAIGGSYEGTLNASADGIEGFWKQGGRSFPLSLKLKDGSRFDTTKDAKQDAEPVTRDDGSAAQNPVVAAPARPQEPKPPFPYESKNLRLKAMDGVELAGTLVLPEGQGPIPAALLVSGSGAQDRDETIYGHKPFWVISDYLARRGIATLRLDDRGVGESQGDFAASTTLDFEADAEAAIEFLRAYPGVNTGKVGIIGHSEGAIIAAMLASKVPELAFAVLLAGPGVVGEELLYQQQAALAGAYGLGPEAIQSARKINQALYNVAKRSDTPENLRAELISVYLSFLPVGVDEAMMAKARQDAELTAEQLLSPWFRTFLVLDPQAYLKDLKLSVLAMNGTKDLQVPYQENLEAIKKGLDAAGNARYSIVELPGLNHLFQSATTGLPDEYSQIEESFSEVALKKMGDWLSEVLGL
jgi:hypothetical protein